MKKINNKPVVGDYSHCWVDEVLDFGAEEQLLEIVRSIPDFFFFFFLIIIGIGNFI